MSLRSKILAIMAFPVIVLGIATGARCSGHDSKRPRRSSPNATPSPFAIRSTAILVDLTDAETGSRGYMLTGEASFLEPYTQGAEALRGDIQTLTGLIGDDPARRWRRSRSSGCSRTSASPSCRRSSSWRR